MERIELERSNLPLSEKYLQRGAQLPKYRRRYGPRVLFIQHETRMKDEEKGKGKKGIIRGFPVHCRQLEIVEIERHERCGDFYLMVPGIVEREGGFTEGEGVKRETGFRPVG